MPTETPNDEAEREETEPAPPAIDAKVTDQDLPRFFSNGFARYSDFAPLAAGGSAQLRTCLDKNLGRTVVMKSLHPHLATNEFHKARFLREARVTSQLQHPNTVPVYELGLDQQGLLYFTMKRLEGDTLYAVLKRQAAGEEETITAYNLERLLGVLVQVCYALAYAHAHRVVHRDVKPENIHLGGFGEVVLLDWGVAKVWAQEDDEAEQELMHRQLTDVGQRPGTPLYMAPEQVEGGGGGIDARTDVYALGVVLYEILTLKEPLRGRNIHETFEMITKEEPIPPRLRTPERQIPEELAGIALKAMQKNPDDRFQTMEEVIAAVRGFRSRAISSARSE
ncbi:MAG: serine/threonine-protein kinase [Planctomycetota bacterium]